MKIYMNETTYITKTELNKVTKKALESNIISTNKIGMNLSEVNGHTFGWNYRKDEGYFAPVCDKKEADMIFVYNDLGTCIKEIRF